MRSSPGALLFLLLLLLGTGGCGDDGLGKDEFHVRGGDADDAMMFLLNEQGCTLRAMEVDLGDPERDVEVWAALDHRGETKREKLLSAYHFGLIEGQKEPWPRHLAIVVYNPLDDHFRVDKSRQLRVLVSKQVGGSRTTGEFRTELPEGLAIGEYGTVHHRFKGSSQAYTVFELAAYRVNPPPGELANSDWRLSIGVRCVGKDEAGTD